MNLQDLQKLLTRGLGMALATRDAQNLPDLTDAMGVDLSQDGKRLRVYICSLDSGKALENIQQNGQVAISIARPADYFAGQIKGKVTATRPLTKEESEKAHHWGNLYRQEIQLTGVSKMAADGLIMNPDTALEVEVVDLFIQTPGPSAGMRLVQA